MTNNKKIVAIGNAIVDVVCEVKESFLSQNDLIKGSMSLIDKKTAEKLSAIESVKINSGGSAANTIAAISQLGAKVSFIGKVSNDDFGLKFIAQMKENSIEYISKRYSRNPTAKSFILVTPEGERTMCTFLGCASEIDQEDINEEEIKNAEILYLEGYLWDKDSTIESLKKSINFAKKHNTKIAFTLSDSFCVSRHKKDFIKLIKEDLDILFANEDEIKEITGIKNIEDDNFAKLHEFFKQNPNLITAITRSEKGCIIFENGNCHEVTTENLEKVTDSTGAGDCFAAGFLFGLNNGYNFEKAGWLGNSLALKIIQKFGARFENGEI